MTMVSSASSSSNLPTNAEECGAPQPLTPEREAEIREWLDELGARKDFPSVGPYTALLDSLAEIDRLRAELKRARVTALREAAAEVDTTASEMERVLGRRLETSSIERGVANRIRRMADLAEGGAE